MHDCMLVFMYFSYIRCECVFILYTLVECMDVFIRRSLAIIQLNAINIYMPCRFM